MATQITNFQQPYDNNDIVALGALQVVRFVCDEFRNGRDAISLDIQQIVPVGALGLEAITSHIEHSSETQFHHYTDPTSGFVTFFAGAPMPSPASTSTDSTNAAASPQGDGAKIPRPKNAFVIYRLHNHERVKTEHPGLHNNEISKIIGRDWRAATQATRDEYKGLAEEEKRQHAIDHPGYQYQPRKPSEKKKRMTKSKRAKLDAQSSSTGATMNATALPAQQSQQIPTGNVALPYQNNTPQLTGLVWAADPITTHEEAHTPDLYTEQSRQDQLDFDFEALINYNYDEGFGIPGDFAPADGLEPSFAGDA